MGTGSIHSAILLGHALVTDHQGRQGQLILRAVAGQWEIIGDVQGGQQLPVEQKLKLLPYLQGLLKLHVHQVL